MSKLEKSKLENNQPSRQTYVDEIVSLNNQIANLRALQHNHSIDINLKIDEVIDLKKEINQLKTKLALMHEILLNLYKK